MTLLLVDGMNLFVRSYMAASAHMHLTSPDGIDTGALYLWINAISKHLREEKPDRVVVCWDSWGSQYRLAIDPEYKAGKRGALRDKSDQVKQDALVRAKQFLSLSGIFHVEMDGWEADDIIAAYWQQAQKTDEQIIIVSGDKDLLQLVGPNCVQIRGDARWTTETVLDQKGVLPEHLPAYMAFVGDQADNVRGVPGVGPKRAIKALSEHGWDFHTALEANWPDRREDGLRSLRLVDLRNLPYETLGLWLNPAPVWQPVVVGTPLSTYLYDFLEYLGMESILKRYLVGDLWA